MKKFLIVFTIAVLIFAAACDHGLSPKGSGRPQTGISGTIYYQNWPPADSLLDLRLVVFNNYPPAGILDEVINNRATVYPPLGPETLPMNVDSTNYTVVLKSGRYAYIVVAQQFGPDVFNDWLAAGQYDVTPDSLPTAVDVVQDSLLTGIDIFVDFHNLPVQPF